MARLISYPFRIASSGSVATTEEGIDYFAEELAMLVKTIPGERELVPEYGISDPTFSDFSQIELLEKISMFGPPVKIEDASSNFSTDGRIIVGIVYDEVPLGEEDSGQYDDDDDDDNEDEFDDDEFEDENPDFNFNDAND